MARRVPLAALTLAALCALAGPVHGQSEEVTQVTRQGELALAEIQRASAFVRDRARDLVERAEDLGDDISELRARTVETAMAVLSLQERIRAINDEIARLRARADDQYAALDAERARLSSLAGGLQRMARLPVTALAVAPELTDDVIQGAIVLNSAMEPIRQAAAELRARIDALAATRAELDARRTELEAETAERNARLDELEALTAERQAMLGETEAERTSLGERADRLAEQARTLGALVVALDEDEEIGDLARRIAEIRAEVGAATRISPAAPRPGEATQATPEVAVVNGVLLPAAGRIAVAYGATDRYGEIAQGVTLSVDPTAPVVAPWDGRVLYSGPFADFGDVLILDHGDGYHSVIAGIGQARVTDGQAVLAGEPVAVTLPQSSDSAAATLYFEVRHQGQPINPLVGLADAPL